MFPRRRRDTRDVLAAKGYWCRGKIGPEKRFFQGKKGGGQNSDVPDVYTKKREERE